MAKIEIRQAGLVALGTQERSSQNKFSAVETLDRKGRLDMAGLRKKVPPYTQNQEQRLMDELCNVYEGKKPWNVWNTSLEKYALPLKLKFNGEELTFPDYVEAKAGNGQYSMLDIGVGSGTYYPYFLCENPNIEFYSTTLDARRTVARLQDTLVMCGADAVDNVFPPGYFKMVVSRMGLHGEEIGAIRAINSILEIGGEAILVGDYSEFSMPVESGVILHHVPSFDVVNEALEAGATAAYHLRRRE